MTPVQFSEALERLHISRRRFARLLRVDERTTRRWVQLNGSVPAPVQILVLLMLAGRFSEADLETIPTTDLEEERA